MLLTSQNPFQDPAGVRKAREFILDPDYNPKLPSTVNPNVAKVVSKLIAKEKKNRYHSAREALDDLLESQQSQQSSKMPESPESPKTISGKAAIHGSMDKYIESLNPEELVHMAFNFNSNDQYVDAIKYCTKALNKDPKSSAAYWTRGYARSKSGSIDEALQDLTMALSLVDRNDEKVPQILYHRAFTKRKKGDMQGACEDIRNALDYDPLNEKYLYLRGRVCRD